MIHEETPMRGLLPINALVEGSMAFFEEEAIRDRIRDAFVSYVKKTPLELGEQHRLAQQSKGRKATTGSKPFSNPSR